MGKVVIDTSVLIGIEKASFPIETFFDSGEQVLIPTIALAEYLVGRSATTNPVLREVITQHFESFRTLSQVVEFGEREAKKFAELKAESLRSGKKRTNFDLAIAAHAVVNDAILVTRDKSARLSELTGVVTREV
jgi:tRNA(fMet)-specific endonuclease VapC